MIDHQYEANPLSQQEAHEGIIIRSYKQEDRAIVRKICCDTGFLGDPIDRVCIDREGFADLFTSPYLDYNAGPAWVAEHNGLVIGYLLGATSPTFDFTFMYAGCQTLLKMSLRAMVGRYADHQRSKQFLRWLLRQSHREKTKHPKNAAHLHCNLEKNYRRQRIGTRLWLRFENHLRESGIEWYYGEFFSWGTHQPEIRYLRHGFSVFDRKPTTIFCQEITEPMEIICVRKRIDAATPLHDINE